MALCSVLGHSTTILATQSHHDVLGGGGGSGLAPLQIYTKLILQLLGDLADLKLDRLEGGGDLLHLSFEALCRTTFPTSTRLVEFAAQLKDLLIRVVKIFLLTRNMCLFGADFKLGVLQLALILTQGEI